MRDAPGVVGTTLARIEPATALVALVTLGALALRLSQLHQSLFEDEVWTYQDVFGHSLGSVLRTVHTGGENSPPLFFALAWASAKLGDPTVLIRLPSLILGLATIPMIYILGRQTVGRVPGLIGAAIAAASPFSVYYGIEARPYAMMAFFVALSTVALVQAVRTSRRRWWLVYAVAAAAAAYTHYTSIFVLAVQAAWSLWMCRDRLRAPLLANGGIVLLYLPWLQHLRGKLLGVIGVLEPLNLANVVADVLRVIPGYPYAPLRAIPTAAGLAVIAACAASGLLTLGYSWRRARLLPERLPEKLLVALLAVATPIGLLLYSLVGTDLWLARGLYASLPAGALTLGTLVWAVPRMIRPIAIVAVMVTLVAGTVRAIGPSYARPPFRAAAAYLDRVASPRDEIIVYPSYLTAEVAIPAQLRKPHRLLNATAAVWRFAAAGPRAYATASAAAWLSASGAPRAYAVVDDSVLHRKGTPRPSGFELTASRHYQGLISFTLLTYRPLGRAVSHRQ